ncbi:hypothetical protein BH10ACI1_BH10ACI1_19120 [soil metagenome]
MKKHINSIIAIGVLVFIAMACNASFTTANISSFNFGKNDKAEPATTSFNQGEKIYAVAIVSNAMSKVKVRFKVESTSGGGTPLTKEVELGGSGRAFLEITEIAGGDYKAEATLLDESGKEVDKKTGTFSVKGDSKPTTTEKQNTTTDSDKDKDKDSEDKSN